MANKMDSRQVGGVRWGDLPVEEVLPGIERQQLDGKQVTLIRYMYERGTHFPKHSHPEEQVTIVLTGRIIFELNGRTVEAGPGDVILIPSGLAHQAWVAGEEQVDTINVLAPPRTQPLLLNNGTDREP